MKKGMAIAIFLGAAGLAGAALAEDIPPPPSGPYAASQQRPADAGPANAPQAQANNPNWGPPPPPPPPPYGYGYPAPQQPAANAKTASGQPAAPQGWAPPPPPYGGYYGPRYGYYDGDSTYGRGYGHGRGAGRGHMNGNFSFGGGANFDVNGRSDDDWNGYNRGGRGWGPGWW